jgi:MFS family permease
MTREPRFFTRSWVAFLGARSGFTLAINMQATLVSWYIYSQTGQALDLGLVGLAEFLPFMVMLAFGGAWADRYNRKRLMQLALTAYLFLSAGILVLVHTGTHGRLLLLYGLLFGTGLARGVLSPAQNALLGQLLPRVHLARGSVWNSLVFQFGTLAGPAVGGAVYGIWGKTPAFLLVCLLMAGACVAMLFLPPVASPSGTGTESLVVRLREGFRFVRGHRLLFPAMTMDLVAVLFGGVTAVLPIFAETILKTGPEGLGWLRAAPGFGSLLTAVLVLRFPPGRHAGRILLGCVAGFGLTNLGFALSQSFVLSWFLLFAGGALDNVSAILRMGLVQLYTPDEKKGRVSAINALFIGSSNELGAFESGVAAAALGLVPSVCWGAAVTFAAVAVTGWKAKKLRNLHLKN